jgi:fibronectin-binding autotransporter adhesin
MKRIVIAFLLGGIFFTLALSGLFAAVARAETRSPVSRIHRAVAVPPQQAGTGVIRVAPAPAGVDGGGCGSTVTPCATVQYAVDIADPGEEILVAAGDYGGVAVRDGVTQTVYISKPLTIRGGYTTTDNFAASDSIANPTTLDAAFQGRVFFISGTVEVTLENLTVTHGIITGLALCPESCGGGILATGPLTLSNVTVFSNSSDRQGGGIAALSSTYIIDSRLFENVATTGFGLGGGLYAEGPVIVNNSRLENNTSGNVAGGLYTFGHPLVITSAVISNNRSLGNTGGGVYISFATGQSGTVVISDTVFYGNRSGEGGSLLSASGGGLSGFNAFAEVTNSRFENNRCFLANCVGGAIRLSGGFLSFPELIMRSTQVISNQAGAEGGGAAVNGTVFISDSNFERNFAGGGLTAFSDGGGAILADSAYITSTTFFTNTSGEDGGAILLSGPLLSSTAVLTDVEFIGNVAGNNGGGFAFDDGFFGDGTRIQNSDFISNTAALDGGGIWQRTGPLNLSDSNFARNYAAGPPLNGGFVESDRGGGGVWTGGSVIFTNTQFFSNVARTNGGGLHVETNDAVLIGGSFQKNEAQGDFGFSGVGGGAVYIVGSLQFTDTTFTGNRATLNGGAVLVLGSSSSVVATNGLFQENIAGRFSGGLSAYGDLSLVGTRFLTNTAVTGAGGASGETIAASRTPLSLILYSFGKSGYHAYRRFRWWFLYHW